MTMTHAAASYPTVNPAAKHDLLCSTSIIDAIQQKQSNNINDGGGDGGDSSSSNNITQIETIEALTSSIVQSAIPLPGLPPDIVKLTTIYTYPDAPTRPKPLSRSPRVWRLVQRSLFDSAAAATDARNNNDTNGNKNNLLKRCTIAVKLPTNIPPNDVKSIKNTKFFYNFMQYLHAHDLVAVLACDSAGRISFVVPPVSGMGNNNGDDCYAASLCYAPMKEFLPWAKENYANSLMIQQQQQQNNGEEDEPETWTPQYTPPPEEECEPSGWDDNSNLLDNNEEEPETWTPQYTPPPEEECGPRGWNEDHDDSKECSKEQEDDGTAGLFVPPGTSSNNDGGGGINGGLGGGQEEDIGAGLWGWNNNDDNNNATTESFENTNNGGWDTGDNGGWDTSAAWGNTDNNDNNTANNPNVDATNSTDATGLGAWTTTTTSEANMNDTNATFHANAGAAAADAFYSNLTRSLDTRADSRLYHMRSFNGWVKATQIAELDPDTSRASGGASGGKKRSRTSPMRVLDLACGKGGDLGKWSLHPRKLENYVGVDVARGSLVDAAIRARQMSKRGNKANAIRQCTFTLADLGEDVPGRKRSNKAVRMQQLLTWNLQNETPEEQTYDPVFVPKEGGGISETDKFDVVSIQFAIHYMMQTRKRARRFFHSVSSLLEVGGNLIATTIDARVVVEKLMGLGLDYHFDDLDVHAEVDKVENEERHGNGNKRRKVINSEEGGVAATVMVGKGVCRLKFDSETLHKVFHPPKSEEDMFGLQYTFTLVEGSDHAAGVGEAVDLPEWLTPVPALKELAKESGLQLEYATNFHKFYEERKNPAKCPMAHNALYNMKVLNRDGSISDQEWDVSRMYIALKFRKVGESTIELGEEDVGEDEMRE
ncbi:hypothetical protein ACHAXR_012382 [Thalassiosira sp. AJA248-18]